MAISGVGLVEKNSLEPLMLRADLDCLCAGGAKLWASEDRGGLGCLPFAKEWGVLSGWGGGNGLALLHGGCSVMRLVARLLQ